MNSSFFRQFTATYTYTLHLAVSQLQSQSLKYEDALRNPSSPKYSHLMQVVHDAIDRMVMQSELRDIYHGVHVAGFNNITRSNGTQTSKVSIEPISLPMKGIETEFHLQLSDNSKNEEQIMDVFKKYLQKNNFNLGGTNLYSSQSLIEHLRANGEFEIKFRKADQRSADSENNHLTLIEFLLFRFRRMYECKIP